MAILFERFRQLKRGDLLKAKTSYHPERDKNNILIYTFLKFDPVSNTDFICDVEDPSSMIGQHYVLRKLDQIDDIIITMDELCGNCLVRPVCDKVHYGIQCYEKKRKRKYKWKRKRFK